jgi:hypothetical protein
MSTVSSMSFQAFRQRVAHLLTDDNLHRLADLGLLRAAQLQFARDTRRHYSKLPGQRTIGFCQHFVGTGKSFDILLVCLGILQHVQPAGTRTRVLILVPSIGAKSSILEYFDATAQPEPFLVRHLGMTQQDLQELASHVCVYRRGAAPNRTPAFEAAWVVVATPQSLAADAQSLDPASFSEHLVDEGDHGVVRTRHATPESWCRITERLNQSHLLLMSATRHRADAIPLPLPYSTYDYLAAITDRVVKRISVCYLVPTSKSVLIPNG